MIRRQLPLLAIALAMLMITSAVGAPALAAPGAAAPGPGGPDGQTEIGTDATNSPATHEVDVDSAVTELLDRDDTTSDNTPVETIVLRFEPADRTGLTSDRATVLDTLQAHADATQRLAVERIDAIDGVSVVDRLWIANAVTVEVDPDKISIRDLAALPGVVRVHDDFELTVPDPAAQSDVSSGSDQSTTYGLDQLNVTKVWDQYGVRGAGADVAILDTGVDPDHPDIDIDPDRFIEVESDGTIVNSDPYDSAYHGTHVSGTVAANTPPSGDVPTYGVAPEATLWHGLVIPGGGGSFTQVAAGMQWAASDTDADIVGMSLGADGYNTDMIEPAENIRAAGMILTASIGNGGHNTSGSPGNYYSSFASGAIDSNYDPATFSGGEIIDTQSAYDGAAPDYWPSEYIQPNAAAPGVDIVSAEPGGTYQKLSGTSMSQPHKAGVFALMVSAAGDVDRGLFTDVVEQTAWQPDDSLDDPNTYYGHGVVDAFAAVSQVAVNSGIEGTVTDTNGNPIPDATVETDSGVSTTTNQDGSYSITAPAGTYTVNVDAFGYESDTATVEIPDDETVVTQDFELAERLDVSPIDDQPTAISSGDSITVTVDVANGETLTVQNTANYTGDLGLVVDGTEYSLGETIDLGDFTGKLDITVTTTKGDSGTIALDHMFTGDSAFLTLTTGPTTVYDELGKVAVVDDTEGYRQEWVDVLSKQLPDSYSVEQVSSDTALSNTEAYDTYFIHGLDDANKQAFINATDGVGTIYTSQNLGPVTLDQRSGVLGDPGSVTQGTDMATYTIETDHPIFDGVGGPGDTVTIHADHFGDGASFTDTDATVIASATDGNNAAAVDDSRQDVLLTSFGFGWVEPGEHTSDGLTILTNAIEMVTFTASDETAAGRTVDAPGAVGSTA
ncbi:MAG: subtilisin-like serine protease, partial [halophilic archaeon J07HX5]